MGPSRTSQIKTEDYHYMLPRLIPMSGMLFLKAKASKWQNNVNLVFYLYMPYISARALSNAIIIYHIKFKQRDSRNNNNWVKPTKPVGRPNKFSN